MNDKFKKIIILLIPIILFLVLLIIFKTYYDKNKINITNDKTEITSSKDEKENDAANLEKNTIKTYTNKNLGFTLNYPSFIYLDSTIKEYSDKVYFTPEDGLGGDNFVILTKQTSASSMEEWMISHPTIDFRSDDYKLKYTEWEKNKPNGELIAPGYKIVEKIQNNDNNEDIYIVEEYVIIEYDESGSPIYGKYTNAVIVKNGPMYKIVSGFAVPVEENSKIDPEIMEIIKSFRVLSE